MFKNEKKLEELDSVDFSLSEEGVEGVDGVEDVDEEDKDDGFSLERAELGSVESIVDS